MSENVVEQEPVGEEAPKNIPIPENVDENESVIVSCGEIQGTFLVHKLKVIYDGAFFPQHSPGIQILIGGAWHGQDRSPWTSTKGRRLA